jgi:hypothetical protein
MKNTKVAYMLTYLVIYAYKKYPTECETIKKDALCCVESVCIYVTNLIQRWHCPFNKNKF